MVIFVGSSILSGKSLTSLWQMVNVLQLIQYSSMMTLYYPQIVLIQFGSLSQTSFNFFSLSKLYLYHFDGSKLEDRKSLDYRFENQGISHLDILLN